MDPGQLFFTTLVLVGLAAVIFYVERISRDLRLIRKLVAAFLEQRVAGTVAENRLAAVVQEANKEKKREVA